MSRPIFALHFFYYKTDRKLIEGQALYKGMQMKINIYAIEDQACPECQEKELTYIINCSACHCGNCGSWFDLDGKLLEDE